MTTAIRAVLLTRHRRQSLALSVINIGPDTSLQESRDSDTLQIEVSESLRLIEIYADSIGGRASNGQTKLD